MTNVPTKNLRKEKNNCFIISVGYTDIIGIMFIGISKIFELKMSQVNIIIGKDKGKLLKIPKITADGLVMIEANKGKSSFVPPCTKNVFLKYYSPSVSENNYWTISDAEYYREDIAHCIEQLKESTTSQTEK